MTLTLSVQHRPTAAAGSNTKCLSPANHGLQVYVQKMEWTRAFEMNQLNSIGFPTAREIQIEVDVLGSFNAIIKCSARLYVVYLCVYNAQTNLKYEGNLLKLMSLIYSLPYNVRTSVCVWASVLRRGRV